LRSVQISCDLNFVSGTYSTTEENSNYSVTLSEYFLLRPESSGNNAPLLLFLLRDVHLQLIFLFAIVDFSLGEKLRISWGLLFSHTLVSLAFPF